MSNCIAAPRPLLQSRRATIKLNILAQINDKYPTHSFFSVVSPARDESSCTHAFQAHGTSDHKILSSWALQQLCPHRLGALEKPYWVLAKPQVQQTLLVPAGLGSSTHSEHCLRTCLTQTASAPYPGKETGQNYMNLPPCHPPSKWLAYNCS